MPRFNTLISKLVFFVCLFLVASGCRDTERHQPAGKQAIDTPVIHIAAPTPKVIPLQSDSAQLLQLTKAIFKWHKENDADFYPQQASKNDIVYAGLNQARAAAQLSKLQNTDFFTNGFLNNYSQLSKTIDNKLKEGSLQWNIGELPPFGDGSDPWCKCQDYSDSFPEDIVINNLYINSDTAYYNCRLYDNNGTCIIIKAVRANNKWKLDYLEGFDSRLFIQQFQTGQAYEGEWTNGFIRLSVGNRYLGFWYHGQCIYFYPIHKISDNTFDLIWADDMDCKFDNGTRNTFNLKNFPVVGKPFARYTVKNNSLNVKYYYEQWVKRYASKIQDDVFSETYEKRNNEDL